MELVVRKNDLLRELQLFQGIVERKNTIPILANVLIEARNDEMQMLATDLEVGLKSKCAASVAKGGALTLPAKKLYEIVKALPETDVRIEQDQSSVTVAADRFDSKLQTLPREDFPSVPEASGEAPLALPGKTLRDMIARTQFAITSEDTRYFLDGALLVVKDTAMTLVATDGHRLALVTVPREEAHEGESKLLIPKKTLHELSRLIVDDETVVRVEQAENHFFFHIGERLLISRKREGQFPSYERVIPKGNDKRVEFDRDRLMSAVRRVALLSNERSRAVKLAIEKNKVDVTSSSPEFGEAHELLTVDYAGQAMQICFNAQYVVDFLNVVDTDVVALELKDEVSQAVMRPVNAEGYDYTYVIMPMRI